MRKKQVLLLIGSLVLSCFASMIAACTSPHTPTVAVVQVTKLVVKTLVLVKPLSTPSVPTRTPAPAIQPEDCLPYNPANLKVIDEGNNGWVLTDGRSRMLMLDNEADAKDALELARRYTAQCFIGRDNKRSNRSDYIVEYWTGSSGLKTAIARRDCISYKPEDLQIVDEGANGWLLTDLRSQKQYLDNKQDAQNALIVGRRYTQHCYIGRGNKRLDPTTYIVEYWE